MKTRTTVRIIAALSVGTLGLAIGAAAPAQGALTTHCEGLASDVTVPNDLIVPKDASCDLTNVVIDGDVTVRAGASLRTDGVKISGSLTARQGGYGDLIDTSVAGDLVLAQSSYGVFISDGTVGGDTVARQSGFLYSDGTRHEGSVRSTVGETYLVSAVVGKHVKTNGDLVSDVDDTWVKGNLSVRAAELGSVVCGSEIDGNGAFTENSGTLQVGLDVSGNNCGSTYVGKNLRVSENSARTVISNAIVRGNLNCVDNDPAPVGENNRVRGKMLNQCEDLAATGESTLSTQRATAKKVETSQRQAVEQIETRRSAAHAQAVKSGAADLG